MNDVYDIFKTKEFKELSWNKRLLIRVKIAFFEFIKYY